MKVTRTDKFFSEGHGWQEICTLRRVDVSDFNNGEFAKYRDVVVVFQVTAQVLHVKKDVLTTDTRYFIGDRGAAALSIHEAATYIRDHWRQKCYHWEKDAVMGGEDDCPTKTANGSRALGILRGKVTHVGRSLYASVKTFLDRFAANPKGEFGT